MIEILKKVGSLQDDPRIKGYRLKKYPHPDSGKKPSDIGKPNMTLEEAQEYCERPESSFKEGPTEDWYFIGYVKAGSRSSHITLW